ncbi:hypothetical protein HYPBUDRAFT_7109 [Hyphopichia burtonii NRRL Y-1933]|uniref:Uncharacterized protein n=1 Tax=Hyphopichia burtonii NRRL Y-1933 TaxID=984485 RepID=A0A1E4RHI8_9ASCO|nr:hypothetical protein HYPBUDRAFT_7109 [Hyphopichia burtonii NRRL Y-1933]ODV66728.1 hypothetical protein HYPBUDRAFT_7109 [Hyphopichia burtonii NRRL Y-1933]
MVSDKSSQVSSSNGRSTDQVKGRPDLLYLKNEVPLLIVEVKGPRFSDLVKDGINESSEAFKSIKRQSNSHVEGECESWTGFEVLQGEGHRSHHHDIATRNCKVADGNIVFLDFSHAKNRESKYDNSDDIHDLKYIYEYNKLEESDDDKYSTVGSAPFSEVQFPSTAGTEPTKPDSK